MTSAALLEILASLTLQVGILVVICGWLARRTPDVVSRDRLWALAHLMILLLAAGSLLMPHLRWTTLAALTPTAWQPSLVASLQCVSWWIGGIWMAGCTAYFCVLVHGILRGAALVRASSAPADGWLDAVLDSPRRGTDAHSEFLRIRVSPRVAGPLLWQFHNPTIVLCPSVLAFPRAEARAILAHETAHFRAGHPLQLFLQRLVEMLFWYHPFVWRASRAAAAARELRCDAEAVSSAEEAQAYLGSLIRLMESRRPQAVGLPAGLDFLGNSRFLRERTAAILKRFGAGPVVAVSDPPRTRRRLLLACIAIAGSALLWLPLNPGASQRSHWSPWPSWSADALDSMGVQVRDYEVDGHRLTSPPHAPHSSHGRQR